MSLLPPELRPHCSAWHRIAVGCSLAAKQLGRVAERHASNEATRRRRQLRDRLTQGGEGMHLALRLLKPPPPGHLTLLCDDEGITCSPDRIDLIAQSFWGGIYEGNIEGDRTRHAKAFIAKFAHLIPSAQPAKLSPLSGSEVREAFRSAHKSAPVPDNWTVPLFEAHALECRHPISPHVQLCGGRGPLAPPTYTC